MADHLDMLANTIPTVWDRRLSIGLAIVLVWGRGWRFAADAGPARHGVGREYRIIDYEEGKHG